MEVRVNKRGKNDEVFTESVLTASGSADRTARDSTSTRSQHCTTESSQRANAYICS